MPSRYYRDSVDLFISDFNTFIYNKFLFHGNILDCSVCYQATVFKFLKREKN